MIVFILTVTIVVLLMYLFERIKRRGLKLPPEYPDKWPIIGSAHVLIGSNTKDLMKICDKLGRYCIQRGGVGHAYFGPYLVFAVTDPDDMMTVLNTCLEKNWIYDFGKDFVGDGLITCTLNLDRWRKHRKIFNRAFNQQVLDGYIEVFNNQSKQFVKALSEKVGKGPFDHLSLLETFTLAVMFQTTMGLNEDEMQELSDREHQESIRALLNIFAKRLQCFWLYSQFIYSFTSLKKKENELIEFLKKKSDAVIRKRQHALKNTQITNPKFKSFLDLMLEASIEESLTIEEMKEEVDTMIVAGADTTATMLTFALTLLGAHQDIQDKVYEELKEVFNGSLRDVEKQDLSKLVFLEAVLMETMRLYPITPMLPRYVVQDLKLKNYTIPAGTSCFMFVYNMHRDPALWGEDSEEFKPERWLPNPPPAAKYFAGFSIGKRGCVGKVHAMMSMKTTLAHVLRHYRVVADVSKLEVQLDLLLKPASGYHISLERRIGGMNYTI